jgi:hypothetical protein
MTQYIKVGKGGIRVITNRINGEILDIRCTRMWVDSSVDKLGFIQSDAFSTSEIKYKGVELKLSLSDISAINFFPIY